MGLTCKPIGKFRGMIHKVEIAEIKRKEEMNARKSQKKKVN